jgi:hypothetical protein
LVESFQHLVEMIVHTDGLGFYFVGIKKLSAISYQQSAISNQLWKAESSLLKADCSNIF